MQEDLIMEKKTLQTFSKNTNNKRQDVSNTKSYSRGTRRREPTSGSSTFKNETSRKNKPQRNNKMVDKRPRPRGYYYTGAVEGNSCPGINNEHIEHGSILVQGSKKQNLNHLLNFHFEMRDTHWRSGVGNGSYKSGGRLMSTHKHKYNKEQFLQANCQFVVKAGVDYKLHMIDPDTVVNWNLIVQVNINVIEYPSCPICLYPPTAAKMTRCGHIYCWPCILHYLSLSDKNWRKCPICFENVHINDLKSVVAVPHLSFNTREEITFNLMKKLRGSLKVCPIDENCSEDVLPKVSDFGSTSLYSKFLIAEKSDIVKIIIRERSELEFQLKEDGDSPEKCFIQQALEMLLNQESAVLLGSEEVETVNKQNVSDFDQTETDNDKIEKEEISENKGIENTNCLGDEENIRVEDLEITPSSAQKLSKYFFFYQASDGQHIYLHSLNIKMLEHTYGSLENCPKTITGKIIEKESGSMTEELRKRLRYLNHLPITCPFEVAEIQLKPPIVSLNTIVLFTDQIESRKNRRRRREKEEKRREKRINEEENKKMGRFRSANIQIESHRQFPDFSFDLQSENAQNTGRISPQAFSERSLSPNSLMSTPLSNSLSKDAEIAGPSFAKMLSMSKPRTKSETESKPLNSSVGSLPKIINVTGSHVKSSFSKKVGRQSDSEPEDYVPAPAFNQSFGDAIAVALQKATLATNTDDDGESQQKGKKKKKNKQKIIFATSMTFSGK